jgi:hypothetical protein
MWIKAFDFDGLTVQQIRDAALSIMRTRKIAKMPTYAEFIESIKGSADAKALEQATLILTLVRQRGMNRPPSEYLDPVTARLMSTRWRWREICEMEASKAPWWVKEFVAAYLAVGEVKQVQMIECGSERMKQLTANIGN